MWRQRAEQRLEAAAAVEETSGFLEETGPGYEEERCRLKDKMQRYSDAVFNPRVCLHRLVFPADVQQTVLIKEEAPEEWRLGVDQQDPETLIIKEEEEELWTSLDVEQLNVKVEADDTRFSFTTVPLKNEDDEEKPLFSQLHQHQVEDGDPPTSSSADQMKAAVDEEDIGIAETTWKSTYEDDFSSSETEVSEDDEDVNDPDPQLKDLSDSISSKKIQSEQKSFSCGVCGKIFNRKYRTTHMRIHSGQKPFVCDVCGHEFGQRSTLQTHLRIHSGQKLFPCDVCGHTFARKPYLIAHMRIHTGQKPFACDICGHRCGQKSNLNRHMRIHTGQKPFSCDVCGHKFGQKSTLNRHMRIHTGQKPFSCDFCGQMFGLKSHLNSHTRIHTGQKPFACDVCGHRFREKSDLNRHIKIHMRGKNSLSLNNRIAPKDT